MMWHEQRTGVTCSTRVPGVFRSFCAQKEHKERLQIKYTTKEVRLKTAFKYKGRHAGLPLRLMTYILFIPLYPGEVGGAAAYSFAAVYLGKKMLYVAVKRCLQGYITMRHLRATQE